MNAAVLRREAELFLKFGMVGVAGFAVDAVVLELAVGGGLTPALARVVSVVVAMHVTFAVNGLFVFGGLRPGAILRPWLAYLAANGFGAVCNYVIFLGLVASGWPVMSERLMALAVGSAVGWGVNFAGTRLVAFRG